MRTKFHARREVWNNAIAIYFGQKSPDGNFFSAQPPVMVKHEMGTAT
jgi:hypothetical protein